MDLGLSEEQEMLRKAARDFLSEKFQKPTIRELEVSDSGYSPKLWKEMAELGWMGLLFPEKYGGTAMSFLDLTILLEEMGRAAIPGPFFSTVICGGMPILQFGNEEQKEKYLPKISNGDLIFTLALSEPSASYDVSYIKTKAVEDQNGYVLNGTKLFIPDAQIADYMLCVAKIEGPLKTKDSIGIFIVDAKSPGISCTALQTIANDKLCEVALNSVRVPKENILGDKDQGRKNVQHIIEQAAIAKCCEMVGGMQQVLEMTTSYAKTRVQYGHPIGSFQAIQHYCANMAIDVDGSRFTTYHAVWMFNEGIPCTKEIAIAKAWATRAYQRVVDLSRQIHGAIGFTIDHDLQFYFRRAKASEATFGDANFYQNILAGEIGLI
jgi:3-oxocholest-4-en-26-oyl-CoA dehydrogenase beta subunit